MSNLKTSLEKALPIVAAAYGEQFGVNVILSGNDAHTDGKTIFLPLLDSMSELKDELFGWLAHESAHVRYSDNETLKACHSLIEKSFTNLIEDIRIERLIQELFPGTQFTLDAMWTYIVGKGMSPPAVPEDNEASQLHQYLLHRLRSQVLHREASTPLAESSQQVVESTFPTGFFIRLDGLLGKYLDDLTCSDDCLKLARAILKALEEAEEDEKKGQEQEGGESSKDDQNPNAPGSGSNDSSNSQQDSSFDESDDQESGSASQQSGKTDGNGSLETGDQPSMSQDQQDSSSGQESTEGDDGTSLHERLTSESDLPEDAIEQLKDQLASQACDDNNGEDISIDTSSVGGDARNKGDTSSLNTGILASSTIRSRLLGLLQAQTRQKQWLHTKGKRVDGKRLTRLASGDSRVFIQRDEMQRPDTSVHVLLDASSSMRDIQDIANQATVSLSLAVSTIPQCDIATSMFPGISGEVSPMIHRGQPVRANLGRFAVDSSGGTPLAEAMLYAARELVASKRQRKVLIIITDGAPNDGGAVQFMNNLIADHVDIYAIGIGSSAVSRYFEKWSVISNVKELQQALFTIAGQFLNLH